MLLDGRDALIADWPNLQVRSEDGGRVVAQRLADAENGSARFICTEFALVAYVSGDLVRVPLPGGPAVVSTSTTITVPRPS